MSVSAAPVIAPTLAGVLIDWSGWRMIFYVSIVIMIVSFVFAICVFDNVLDTVKKPFDVISFVLSVIAFGGVTLGVGNITSYGITDPSTFVPLLAGVIGAIVFVYRQFRQQEPFLDVRILKSQRYSLSVIGSMLLYLVMMGSSMLFTLYVQNVLGLSATVSGLATLPGSLAMAIISPLAGRIYDKIGMRILFIVGGIVMFLSNIGMFLVGMQTPLAVAAILNVVRCIAIGCLMMPFVTWGIGGVDETKTAHGSALLTSLRTVAGSIGTAVFTGIMTVVTAISAKSYGGNAAIHGLNISYLVMAVISFVMFLMAVIFVKDNKGERYNF